MPPIWTGEALVDVVSTQSADTNATKKKKRVSRSDGRNHMRMTKDVGTWGATTPKKACKKPQARKIYRSQCVERSDHTSSCTRQFKTLAQPGTARVSRRI